MNDPLQELYTRYQGHAVWPAGSGGYGGRYRYTPGGRGWSPRTSPRYPKNPMPGEGVVETLWNGERERLAVVTTLSGLVVLHEHADGVVHQFDGVDEELAARLLALGGAA